MSVGNDDLPKWIGARLGFVLGIDYNIDNIENRIDGAYRYLNARKRTKGFLLISKW